MTPDGRYISVRIALCISLYLSTHIDTFVCLSACVCLPMSCLCAWMFVLDFVFSFKSACLFVCLYIHLTFRRLPVWICLRDCLSVCYQIDLLHIALYSKTWCSTAVSAKTGSYLWHICCSVDTIHLKSEYELTRVRSLKKYRIKGISCPHKALLIITPNRNNRQGHIIYSLTRHFINCSATLGQTLSSWCAQSTSTMLNRL